MIIIAFFLSDQVARMIRTISHDVKHVSNTKMLQMSEYSTCYCKHINIDPHTANT